MKIIATMLGWLVLLALFCVPVAWSIEALRLKREPTPAEIAVKNEQMMRDAESPKALERARTRDDKLRAESERRSDWETTRKVMDRQILGERECMRVNRADFANTDRAYRSIQRACSAGAGAYFD